MRYNLPVELWVLAYLYFTQRAGVFEARLLNFCMKKELRTNYLVRQPQMERTG